MRSLIMVMFLLSVLTVSGCPHQTPDNLVDEGLLEVYCEPDDAIIYIDEQYMGHVYGWRFNLVPIAPGRHRLELLRDGYYPHRVDIVIAEDQVVTVRASLLRKHVD